MLNKENNKVCKQGGIHRNKNEANTCNRTFFKTQKCLASRNIHDIEIHENKENAQDSNLTEIKQRNKNEASKHKQSFLKTENADEKIDERKDKRIKMLLEENMKAIRIREIKERLELDVDSFRFWMKVRNINSLSKRWRLNMKLTYLHDSETVSLFPLTDAPFMLFAAIKREKVIEEFKKQEIYFPDSCHQAAISSKENWISAFLLEEILRNNRISFVRVLGADLKERDFQYMFGLIETKMHYSLDIAVTIKSKEGIIELINHNFFKRMKTNTQYHLCGKYGFGSMQSKTLKIYNTIAHHLKKKTKMKWNFSDKMPKNVLKSKILAIEKLINQLERDKIQTCIRIEATIEQYNIPVEQVLSDAQKFLFNIAHTINKNRLAHYCLKLSDYFDAIRRQIQHLKSIIEDKIDKKEKKRQFLYLFNLCGWANSWTNSLFPKHEEEEMMQTSDSIEILVTEPLIVSHFPAEIVENLNFLEKSEIVDLSRFKDNILPLELFKNEETQAIPHSFVEYDDFMDEIEEEIIMKKKEVENNKFFDEIEEQILMKKKKETENDDSFDHFVEEIKQTRLFESNEQNEEYNKEIKKKYEQTLIEINQEELNEAGVKEEPHYQIMNSLYSQTSSFPFPSLIERDRIIFVRQMNKAQSIVKSMINEDDEEEEELSETPIWCSIAEKSLNDVTDENDLEVLNLIESETLFENMESVMKKVCVLRYTIYNSISIRKPSICKKLCALQQESIKKILGDDSKKLWLILINIKWESFYQGSTPSQSISSQLSKRSISRLYYKSKFLSIFEWFEILNIQRYIKEQLQKKESKKFSKLSENIVERNCILTNKCNKFELKREAREKVKNLCFTTYPTNSISEENMEKCLETTEKILKDEKKHHVLHIFEEKEVQEIKHISFENPYLKCEILYRGLKNRGSECYSNSIFQAFFNIKEMSALMAEQCTLSKNLNELNLVRQRGLTKICSTYIDRINHLIKESCKRTDKFVSFKQEDAHEYFLSLVDAIKTELKLDKTIFSIEISQTIECCYCQWQTNKIMQEELFHLALERMNEINIQKMLDNSIKEEIIQDYKCESCHQYKVKRFYELLIVPKVLVLHLKIFVLRRKPKWLNGVPLDLILANKHHYELKGVVFHLGDSPKSGHYLFGCQEVGGFEWIIFNDYRVNKVQSISDIPKDNTPFLLFYVKNDS